MRVKVPGIGRAKSSDVSESGALAALMNPRSIAIVGASQRAARGTRVVRNLVDIGFEGSIYPINPRYDEVLGLPCFPSVAQTPEPADTVVVAIPGEHVPGLLEQAWDAGVRAAVVLSSGFSEAGGIGQARHEALRRLAEQGMAICGPNCYGVFNVTTRAASFSGDIPQPLVAGHVALISQSGGFSNLIANPLMEDRGIGFSYIVSCGNQAGVSIEEYMAYLIEDENTRVIAAFVEGFRCPDQLPAVAARAAELGKPIAVMTVGRSEGARQATLAHTGSLAGSAEVLQALLRQCGIIQVESINDLIETTCLLASANGRSAGWQLGVLTGSGGESGHVADVAEEVGLRLPSLDNATLEILKEVLPDFARPRNPLDGTGAMYENPAVFPRLMDALAADPSMEVIAVNLGAGVPRPGQSSAHRRFAQVVAATAPKTNRLLVAYSSAIGGDLDQEIVQPLRAAGVPYLEGTETAMRALRNLNRHCEFIARWTADGTPDSVQGRPAIASGVRSGVMPFLEASSLLREFGIPVVDTTLASTPDAAVAAAEAFGYPVVLKVEAEGITHKSDVGGVRAGCGDAESVRRAYAEIIASVAAATPTARVYGVLVQPLIAGGVETIVGVKHDMRIGSAVVFGLGGIFTEIIKDATVRVPPISIRDAEEMLMEIRGRALLQGARGAPPSDTDALVHVIVRVGALAQALGERLAALDLNPLVVLPRGRGAVALDVLLVIQ